MFLRLHCRSSGAARCLATPMDTLRTRRTMRGVQIKCTPSQNRTPSADFQRTDFAVGSQGFRNARFNAHEEMSICRIPHRRFYYPMPHQTAPPHGCASMYLFSKNAKLLQMGVSKCMAFDMKGNITPQHPTSSEASTPEAPSLSSQYTAGTTVTLLWYGRLTTSSPSNCITAAGSVLPSLVFWRDEARVQRYSWNLRGAARVHIA